MPREHAGNPGMVRAVPLRRRRSTIPWIYLVYRSRPADASRPAGEETAENLPLAFGLPPEERRDVEWRHRLELGADAQVVR
jgi:hypothetical protein